jgi:CheY-like chemotaxis protein
MSSLPDARAVLVAHSDSRWCAALAERCGDALGLRSATSGTEALELLNSAPFDYLVADFALGEMSGVELLRRSRELTQAPTLVLLADYPSLPQVLLQRGSEVAAHVLPRAEPSHRLLELLGFPAEPPAAEVLNPAGISDGGPLLIATGAALAQLPGVVVRPLPATPIHDELQLVLPNLATFDTAMALVGSSWGGPIKARGQRAPWRSSKVVSRIIGRLKPEQALYLHPIGSHCAYLLVLPWEAEGKVTVVLGLTGSLGELGQDEASLRARHAAVVRACREFPLPRPPGEPGAAPICWFAREYNWVVTRSYVGPDRRIKPMPFLTRYLLFGRRRSFPESDALFAALPMDGVMPRVRPPAIAYLLLSLADTVFSTLFLGMNGLFESNPLMKPLLEQGPIPFSALKNLVSLAGLILVLRFQHWRSARVALWVMVAGYALLDLYWAWVLTSGR